jgi:hypothetical protein
MIELKKMKSITDIVTIEILPILFRFGFIYRCVFLSMELTQLLIDHLDLYG